MRENCTELCSLFLTMMRGFRDDIGMSDLRMRPCTGYYDRRPSSFPGARSPTPTRSPRGRSALAIRSQGSPTVPLSLRRQPTVPSAFIPCKSPCRKTKSTGFVSESQQEGCFLHETSDKPPNIMYPRISLIKILPSNLPQLLSRCIESHKHTSIAIQTHPISAHRGRVGITKRALAASLSPVSTRTTESPPQAHKHGHTGYQKRVSSVRSQAVVIRCCSSSPMQLLTRCALQWTESECTYRADE